MNNLPKIVDLVGSDFAQDAFFRFREGHHGRFCNRPATRAINGQLTRCKAEVFHG